MTHFKRNQLNPITQCRENVQNVLENCYFTQCVKCTHILARFGLFLGIRLSDWTYSFCIGSPTRNILKRQNFSFILHYTPLEGVCQIFFGGKKIFPDSPYMPGNRMRYLRKWNVTKRGEWDTLLPHTIPCHTIPYHTISYHRIPSHTISYHLIPSHTISYHPIPSHTIPFHPISSHTISYRLMPSHTI